MLYQFFEQTIAIIKQPKPDQEALHNVAHCIVDEIATRGASKSSLRLLKYLLLKLRRNHSLCTLFSDSTNEYLAACFKKDPSHFTTTFLYALSIFEQTSDTYLLEKMTYSAWRLKKIADEAVKECKNHV